MDFLVVGAGATGGSLPANLIATGRDVTLVVRPATAARLANDGAAAARRRHSVA